MSVLVILIPPRPRHAAGVAAPTEYDWVLGSEGSATTAPRHGRGGGREMPRAEQVLAVLPDADVAWHRITLPKAPAAKLRAALGAVLEDVLLDDDEAVHLALEPQAAAGQPAWVAATTKPWLAAVIAELEGHGVPVDRIVPASWPTPLPAVHFAAAGDEGPPLAVLSHADGVVRISTGGTLARARLAPWLADAALQCTAEPAAAAAAERWLAGNDGHARPVAIVTAAERALAAARSAWNLRQFDLVAHHRGALLLRDAWRQFLGPEWRPVRIGAVALLAVQLLALNAWAWRLERHETTKRDAMTALLRETHPQVRAVLDAPAQMQRETEVLRASAGRAGEADLEALLGVAASAWPDGAPPAQNLRFEPGRLTLATAGWSEPQTAAFAERARAAGYVVEPGSEQLVLRRP